MLEVTLHGMVTCRCTEGTCPYNCDDDPDNRKYIIRLNIDLSSDNVCETKYDVPKDVATEMLAGMFVHNLGEALYVTVTKDAVTVVELLGLQSIWDDALSVMVDLYSVQNIKQPTKLHPGVRQLHEDLTEYVKFNTRLISCFAGVQSSFFTIILGHGPVSCLLWSPLQVNCLPHSNLHAHFFSCHVLVCALSIQCKSLMSSHTHCT